MPTVDDRDEALSAAFAALADPSRRQVLGLLRESAELRVSDIAAVFDMSLNGVSKHLKVLEKAGLVLRRRHGRTHWIRANWEGLAAPQGWLDAHQHFWTRRLDAVAQQFESPDRSHPPKDEGAP